MNIELRHLRYFIAVAEELHFGRAALRLNISQPPLSQQIQLLEQQIGARLLARTNRSVQLTAAGRQFLQDARAILLDVEQAASRAARLHQGEEGEIRIGFTSSAPFIAAVSDALFNFRQRYPQVHIQMQEMNTRQQLTPLSDGRLDLGVMRNTPLPDTLAAAVAARAALLRIASCASAGASTACFSARSGTGAVCLLRCTKRHCAVWRNYDAAASLSYPAVYHSGSRRGDDYPRPVATGLGISILPASFRRAQLAHVVWLPLAEPDARSEMWLVWSRQRKPAR